MISETQNPFIFYIKGIESKSFYDEEKGEKRYFVKGHIDSEDLDLVNDIVTKGCMSDISTQFKARNIKLDLDHETLRQGDGEAKADKKYNLTRVPLGKAISESLDNKGNLVQFELNPNWKKFNSKGDIVMTFKEVWGNIKSGFYDAFSIAYIPIKTAIKSINDSNARMLEKVNLINVALTGNPINPSATMSSVMAKSLEWIKSQEGDKMEKKAYPKDGAHSHDGDNTIGEHSHPEIEKVISLQENYLSERIRELSNEIYDIKNKIQGETQESDKMIGKSKGDKMEEEPKQAEPAKEEKKSEEPKEEKSIDAKAFGEMKSKVEAMEKSIGDMKESFDKMNEFLEKSIPSGNGATNPAEKESKPEIKSNVTSVMGMI